MFDCKLTAVANFKSIGRYIFVIRWSLSFELLYLITENVKNIESFENSKKNYNLIESGMSKILEIFRGYNITQIDKVVTVDQVFLGKKSMKFALSSWYFM